jgi:cell division protein FtsB
MLVDELKQVPPAIDFFHPKKRPQARTRRERVLLFATAVVGVLCASMLAIKLQWNAQDRQIAQLRSELKTMEERLKEVRKRAEELKLVDNYVQSAPPWLDELKRLSLKLPPAKDAIVRKFSGTTDSSGTARIAFEAWVSDPRHIEQSEEGLRDDAHQVFGGGTTVRPDSSDGLRWSYKGNIVIDPRKIRGDEQKARKQEQTPESRPTPAQPAPGESFTSSATPREEAKR